MLNRISEIHKKKNDDYSGGDPFENFKRAAHLLEWFDKDHDKVFVNHIATKLARLSTLLNSDRAPNNESVADSFLDLATYCILWASSHEVHFGNSKHINYEAVEKATIRRTEER